MIAAHTADWHLSASGSRLDPSTGRNAALMDRYRCARFVIEDAVARGAQVILHAGDPFNSPRPTPSEVRLVKEALAPAQRAGTPTVMLRGNHDDVRSPVEQHALDLLREMEGVTIVDRPQIVELWAYDSATSGRRHCRILDMETDADDHEFNVLQIACLPYPNRQLLLRDAETRDLSPGDLNQLVREKMMEVARGLAAQRIEGVPAVLLGHFAVDTAQAGTQNSLAMLGGEFSLNVHDLAALGFDAVMLGHYHKPQSLHELTPIVYSGSPEACAFGEEGEEKRYLLWRIADDGEEVSAQSIPTPYRRLVTLGEEDFQEGDILYESASERCEGAIVRLQIPAAAKDKAGAWRSSVEACRPAEIRIENERAETVRRREVEITAQSDLPTALDGYLEQHPDYRPMRGELLAVAQEVVAQTGGGA